MIIMRYSLESGKNWSSTHSRAKLLLTRKESRLEILSSLKKKKKGQQNCPGSIEPSAEDLRAALLYNLYLLKTKASYSGRVFINFNHKIDLCFVGFGELEVRVRLPNSKNQNV